MKTLLSESSSNFKRASNGMVRHNETKKINGIANKLSSRHAPDILSRTPPRPRQQRHKRSPYYLNPRSNPRHPPSPPALPLPVRTRNLHEPPPRPSRTRQLPRNSILHSPNPSNSPPRQPSQYPHLRSSRRPPHSDLPVQNAHNLARGKTQTCRVPLFLPHA